MSKREDEDFAKWLGDRMGELKGKDPDAAKHLEALASSEAGRELYRGSIREADYYRRLNEHTETKRQEEARLQEERKAFEADLQKQTEWFKKAKPEYETAVKQREEYKRKLDAYEKQLKELGVESPNPPAAQPPHADNEEIVALKKMVSDYGTRVEQMDRAFPQFMTQLAEVAFQSNKEGFNVPPSKIMETVFSDNVSPVLAYEKLTKEERVKRATAELEKRLEEAKELGRKEALSSLQNPGRIPLSAPSMVDTLRSGEAPGLTDPTARRDAAIAEFLEMTQGA